MPRLWRVVARHHPALAPRRAVPPPVAAESGSPSPVGDQIPRPAGFRFKLAPQLRHEYPQVAGIGVIRRSAQVGQQRARCHEPARLKHESRQQVPLGRREVNTLAVRANRGGGREVDGDVSELDRCRFDGRLRPAGYGAHPSEQLLHAERLGDVVVGSEVERLHLVRAADAGREHDNRGLGVSADAADDVDAGNVRQPEIQDDEIWSVPGRRGERLGAGPRLDHVIVAGCEVHRQRAQQGRLVVDDENSRHAFRSADLGRERARRSEQRRPLGQRERGQLEQRQPQEKHAGRSCEGRNDPQGRRA